MERELGPKGEGKMKDRPETAKSWEKHIAKVKFGNTEDCLKTVSAAIAKRAYEIYERQGRRPGCDRENWLLAEREILPPLCCGILESKDEVIVSLSCSALGAKDLEEIEACVEPHRLILVGKKGPGSGSAKDASVYRVLHLAEEFDPSSAKVRQQGSLLDIEIRKSGVNKNSTASKRAA
jgi:hypothetical protein